MNIAALMSKPADTASSEDAGFFDRMKGVVVAGWDKTRSMFQHDTGWRRVGAAGDHPQPYGRAGGYVGWERIAVLSMVPTMANSAVVRTGTEWANLADMHARSNSIESTDTAEALDHRSSASDPTTAPADMRDEDTPAAAVTPSEPKTARQPV